MMSGHRSTFNQGGSGRGTAFHHFDYNALYSDGTTHRFGHNAHPGMARRRILLATTPPIMAMARRIGSARMPILAMAR
jgi:hypothetical protein